MSLKVGIRLSKRIRTSTHTGIKDIRKRVSFFELPAFSLHSPGGVEAFLMLFMKNSSFKVKIENPHTGQKIERKVSYPDFKVYSACGYELDEFNPYSWNFTASENGDIYFLDFALDTEIFQKELEENNYKKVPDFRVNLKCLKNNWKHELALSAVPQKLTEEKKSETTFNGFSNFLKGKNRIK